MKLIDLIKTANTNLVTAKLRTTLTVMAIIVGSLVLSLTFAVGTGAKDFLDRQTSDFGYIDALSVVKETSDQEKETKNGLRPYNPDMGEFGMEYMRQEDMDYIKTVENVEHAFLFNEVTAEYIEYDNEKYSTIVDMYVDRMQVSLSAGNVKNFDSKNSVALGYGFVKGFGYEKPEDLIGKTVKIAFKDIEDNIKVYEFKVSAVFSKSIIVNDSAFIGPDAMEDIRNYQLAYNTELLADHTGGAIYLKSGVSDEEVEKVKEVLKEKGYKAETFEDKVASLKDDITKVQMALAAFSAVPILAASFGIVNTLLMSVYERTREIGLMKALGMKGRVIFNMFALEAAIIGFWGSSLGVILAMLSGVGLNYLASETILKPYEGFTLLIFNPLPSFVIVLFIMLISFLAGALPAIKAMKLNPIEALKYE